MTERTVYRLYMEALQGTNNYWNERLGKWGYTICSARGHYQGVSENSIMVDVMLPTGNIEEHVWIHKCAREYCEQFRQEAVLVTKQEVDASFIGPGVTYADA
jgi:hypothetical protein